VRLAFSSGSCFLASGSGCADCSVDAADRSTFSTLLLAFADSAFSSRAMGRWCASNCWRVSFQMVGTDECSDVGGQTYLLLITAQVILPVLYIVVDVILKLLPSQLDAAGQGIQLLAREAWYLGQARVWL
jgi:hypothetical protein